MSYFEVPEEDAERVAKYINGQHYKGREVRCNDAAEGGKPAPRPRDSRDPRNSGKPGKPGQSGKSGEPKHIYQKEEWMQFLNPNGMKTKGAKGKAAKAFKGEEPDFSEEGWAIRKPRKKK